MEEPFEVELQDFVYKKLVIPVRCNGCGKKYDKNQKVRFTLITGSAYIKCPYCKHKKFIKF